MLWFAIVLLFVLWLFGFSYHLAGDLIHILIFLVVVGIIYQLVTYRRPPAV